MHYYTCNFCRTTTPPPVLPPPHCSSVELFFCHPPLQKIKWIVSVVLMVLVSISPQIEQQNFHREKNAFPTVQKFRLTEIPKQTFDVFSDVISWHGGCEDAASPLPHCLQILAGAPVCLPPPPQVFVECYRFLSFFFYVHAGPLKETRPPPPNYETLFCVKMYDYFRDSDMIVYTMSSKHVNGCGVCAIALVLRPHFLRGKIPLPSKS